KYKLDVLQTMAALKFLERDGWLTLSEAVFIPSRFKFEIDFQELYKFQVQSAKYDPIIKAILRTYGVVFDFFVRINEYEFAKKLARPDDAVVGLLDNLHKQEIGSCCASADKPRQQLLHHRVEYKNLHNDSNFIREQ